MSENNKYHKKIKEIKEKDSLYKIANKAIADYQKGFRKNTGEVRDYFRWKIKQVSDLFKKRLREIE